MKTRMDKYYDENPTNTSLRQHKNKSLYENISNVEVDDYKLETNATVLENNAKNIDVEKIKKILDTKYNRDTKRRSIVIEDIEEETPSISLDETREYDINAILEQARSEKEVDYEKERVKKIRDTQFDILNSLELNKDELDFEDTSDNTSEISSTNITNPKKDNDELIDLINTITIRELYANKEKGEETSSTDELVSSLKPDANDKTLDELNPLEILTDLKGSDDTIVISGAHEEESISETSPIMSLEEATKIRPQILDKLKEQEQKKEDQIKEEVSELTKTMSFTESDFDDFADLKKEVKSNRALIYTAIILVSIVLIAGLVIFLNKFLNLSLF